MAWLSYRDAKLEGPGDGDGRAADQRRDRRGRGGGRRGSLTTIAAAPGHRDQERPLGFVVLSLHGFSLSVRPLSLVLLLCFEKPPFLCYLLSLDPVR